MNAVFKSIVLDAVFSQTGAFDCVAIMRYIKENEIQGKTFPHQEIDIYLDSLRSKGLIAISSQTGQFISYEIAKELPAIDNGDKVTLKGDGSGEIFTVSELSETRCWIGDAQGRGWYVNTSRLEKIAK